MTEGKPTALVAAVVVVLCVLLSGTASAGELRFEPVPAGGPDSIGDTLYSFRAPARWPCGLAWDGTDLWMTDNDEDSLYRLSTEGTVLAAFALPESINSPAGMTFIGKDLWMIDENTATLYVMDTALMAPRKSFRLPDSLYPDATSWGLAWDGAHLWHCQYARGQFFQLDTTDGAVLSQFAPVDSWIMGIEYDGQHLWGVSQQTDRAFVMSLPSGTVIQTYDWHVPYSLGMTWVAGYMWCASGKTPSGTRRIYKVDIGQGGLAEKPESPALRRRATAVPNPFRAGTRISAGRRNSAMVGVRVFDTQGRLVRELSPSGGAVLWNGTGPAGRHRAPGAYVVCVRFADGSSERLPVCLSR